MPVVRLDHLQVAIPAGGEGEARGFYGRLLGLAELPKPTSLAGRGGAWFQCAAIQVHLGIEEPFIPAKKAHPAFQIEQFDELLRTLCAAGYAVTEDASIPAVRRAFTADPFGNRIELVATDDAV
ncbi:MAG: glyoxalase [Burkholderiales bacterium]|jgi:catechol 2,3-dioxygenase-like lactoylglutathione lyase family enzyme|nr:glyoxalase [Burkholderiales bacterium]